MGEMFPGKKLQHEGSGDSDGQGREPHLDLDLDAGVVRLTAPEAEPTED
ncbi:hypothetical protein [Nocardia coubleae]|uniref:Uncharacterized protein n=1 Tax=Nocardia coubleae TaxID=356147 RepID=A0A846W066_9NOCA|nr:hypothetical protein [Nocardia coubleae]NKX86489.1 hypothetical protein [Nocardia coubleae]